MVDNSSIAGFADEFLKISDGMARIGRRPISAERLLEKETETAETPSEVFAEPKTEPAATTEKVAVSARNLERGVLVASGFGGYHVLDKANEDRKIGKAVREQQG